MNIKEQIELILRNAILDFTFEGNTKEFIREPKIGNMQYLINSLEKITQAYGKEQYNNALEDAFNVAKVGHVPCGDIRACGCNGACERPIAYVDGRSILNLKKQ